MAMKISRVGSPVSYVSKQPDLEEWIRDFSTHLKAEPEKNHIIYPESFATGFAKVYSIEDGLTYRIVDYTLNTDFIFLREPAEKFYLIIYFYQYSNCSSLQVYINDIVVIKSEERDYSSLLMTNSNVSQRLLLAKGTTVKGLTIQITEEWLMEKIAQPRTANYELFKKKNVFQSFLNPKSQKLLNEIFDENLKSVIPELHLNNRVLRLLEIFLEGIIKYGITGNTFPSLASDVQNILKVENYLLECYLTEFPSIEKLARMSLMSPTKLKNIFKKAFGMGLYEYYQKNRMHKAKELLSTGLYSVTDVGEMIGYQNLSNFSSAFRKEFKCLPKDYAKIG
ncbi:MAG: helix-turn-helix transcriptional regulator [Ginsengibacter sp.]